MLRTLRVQLSPTAALLVLLGASCAIGSCGDSDPDPLVFEGIHTLAAEGASGLIARWDPATGGGPELMYTAQVEELDGRVAASEETRGTVAWFEGLDVGLYRVSVTARDAPDREAGGDVSLQQLVGTNRLRYMSDVPLPAVGGGEIGGADVWGDGSTLVIAGMASATSFMVVDASDPFGPVVLANAVDGGFVKDVKIGDGLLFTNAEPHPHGGARDEERHGVGSDDGIGARVWDFADPAAPVLLAEISQPSTSSHNVSYGEGYLYLQDNNESGFYVWDVSAPSEPSLAWDWQPPSGGVHDLAWVDGTLTVAWWDGFSVFDVSDPLSPVEVVQHSYAGGACHNAWLTDDGGHVLTSDEMEGGYLRVWDVSDPDNVEQVGTWATESEGSIHNVHVLGDLAFVAYYKAGVFVLDINDPAQPVKVGWYDTFDEPDVEGDDDDDDDDDDGIDPDCWDMCIEICLENCPGCDDFCEGECVTNCSAASGGDPDDLFDGAWGIWPYGDHVAVGDLQRGLVILDFHPRVVVR